jgi:hypothetical protein
VLLLPNGVRSSETAPADMHGVKRKLLLKELPIIGAYRVEVAKSRGRVRVAQESREFRGQSVPPAPRGEPGRGRYLRGHSELRVALKAASHDHASPHGGSSNYAECERPLRLQVMDAKELLKMETALKEARQKVREELPLKAEGALAELRAIGFDYELVEKNDKPKMGRPRKETNGKVHVAQNA